MAKSFLFLKTKFVSFPLKSPTLLCFSPTRYLPLPISDFNWAPARSFSAAGPSHPLSRSRSPVAQGAKPGVPRAPCESPRPTQLPALRGADLRPLPKQPSRAFPLFFQQILNFTCPSVFRKPIRASLCRSTVLALLMTR